LDPDGALLLTCTQGVIVTDANHHLMTIFTSALDHEAGADRDAYLAEACGADPALRARVEGLLRVHEHGSRFLEPTSAGQPPTRDVRADAPVANATGAWVGPPVSAGSVVAGRYNVLEEIGEGGMGAVWMAEQTEPVQRRVAVKLIKPGMDTRQVVARFEAERQALALMDHPHIAKVLDSGATLSMEEASAALGVSRRTAYSDWANDRVNPR